MIIALSCAKSASYELGPIQAVGTAKVTFEEVLSAEQESGAPWGDLGQ